MLSEIVFEVTQGEDGGYSAKAVGESIFTQGDTWDDLREMARDAVKCHFGEAEAPSTIRLHLLHEEVFAAAWSFHAI